MIKKQNLFAWYYENGIHELFEIIKNYFLFCLRFFSVSDLTLSLFSPWHRDVSRAAWRGFHPVKALGLLVENLLSRCIGGIVRLMVISFGLISAVIVALLGIIIAFIWIAVPIVVIGLIYAISQGLISLPVGFGIIFLYAVIVFYAYWVDQRETLLQISLDNFYRSKIYDRVCDRLGVSREFLTLDVLQNEALFADFLKQHAVSLKEYQKIVHWELHEHEKKIIKSHFWRWENLQKISPIGMYWRYAYTVNLDRYSINLSESDPTEYRYAELIGRENQLDVLELILERPDQNCVLLVGAAGIGKKTLLHALGRNIRQGNSAEYLKKKRLILLDVGRAISDAINQGLDVESQLRELFMEASYAGNVILVIEHIEHFISNETSMYHPNISAVIDEFLSLPTFQLIATSTVKEYHQLLEKQENLVKFFEVVELTEPNEDEIFEIMLMHFQQQEFRQVLFTYQAMREIIRSANRLNWEFPQPERSLDLAMNVLMYWEKNGGNDLIEAETVAQYIALKTGTPQGEIESDERKKLLNLEKILHRHVIGQEPAIGQIARALRRARTGIGNAERPIGSFLFMGPTGVGKTETAKALAKVYFGDEKKMVRLDMSEYQNPASIERLIGSQQLNQPGQLATKAKDNPYALLLLDELEKAYPDVLDIFLQILDEGFMTDAFGEKINFRNMIIIATSNVGSQIIKEMVESHYGESEIKQAIIDYAVQNNIFRLEFLNRFNDVIFFSPLDERQLNSVVKLQLKKFARRLCDEKNIEVAFGDAIVQDIIEKGYNPVLGARSLNRYIEEKIEDLVAQQLIEGNIRSGEKININI